MYVIFIGKSNISHFTYSLIQRIPERYVNAISNEKNREEGIFRVPRITLKMFPHGFQTSPKLGIGA